MSLVAFPTPAAGSNRKRIAWLAVPAIVVLAIAVAFAATRLWMPRVSAISNGPVFVVVPTDFEVAVKQKGELQAINNIDIVCLVEGQTTIQTIVPEGAAVKKGDVLVTLDSSTIKQRIEDSTLDLQKAESDVVASRELRDIQESQNATNLEAAQVALKQAQLDLAGYTEGTYPQQLAKAKTDLQLMQIALKNKQESLAQTRSLFNKGFVTASDVKTAEQDVVKAQIDVSSAQNALNVLEKYTHESELAAKNSALSQSEQKLVRTQRENAATLNQKNADVSAKEQSLAVLRRRMEHLKDQLEACTIHAPADGMVVYATSSDRWSQTPIQEGTQVRERQAILRLPDTSAMKAVVRINESQVGKLFEGQRAKVTIANVPNPVWATLSKISVLADSSQRFWGNSDVKEYPVDLALDETPKNLRPGIGVNVDIKISRTANALAVPLQALYSAGNDAYVFIPGGKNPRGVPTKVKIGQVNDTHAQILSGLSAGQSVRILEAGEGRDLLEQAGIKLDTPTTRGSDSDYVSPRRGRGNGAAPGIGGPGAGNRGGPVPPNVPGGQRDGNAPQAVPGGPGVPVAPGSGGRNSVPRDRESERSTPRGTSGGPAQSQPQLRERASSAASPPSGRPQAPTPAPSRDGK